METTNPDAGKKQNRAASLTIILAVAVAVGVGVRFIRHERNGRRHYGGWAGRGPTATDHQPGQRRGGEESLLLRRMELSVETINPDGGKKQNRAIRLVVILVVAVAVAIGVEVMLVRAGATFGAALPTVLAILISGIQAGVEIWKYLDGE